MSKNLEKTIFHILAIITGAMLIVSSIYLYQKNDSWDISSILFFSGGILLIISVFLKKIITLIKSINFKKSSKQQDYDLIDDIEEPPEIKWRGPNILSKKAKLYIWFIIYTIISLLIVWKAVSYFQ